MSSVGVVVHVDAVVAMIDVVIVVGVVVHVVVVVGVAMADVVFVVVGVAMAYVVIVVGVVVVTVFRSVSSLSFLLLLQCLVFQSILNEAKTTFKQKHFVVTILN